LRFTVSEPFFSIVTSLSISFCDIDRRGGHTEIEVGDIKSLQEAGPVAYRQHREYYLGVDGLPLHVLRKKRNAFVAACQQRKFIGSLSFKAAVIPLGRWAAAAAPRTILYLARPLRCCSLSKRFSLKL
jgi:hypothetical protein